MEGSGVTSNGVEGRGGGFSLPADSNLACEGSPAEVKIVGSYHNMIYLFYI